MATQDDPNANPATDDDVDDAAAEAQMMAGYEERSTLIAGDHYRDDDAADGVPQVEQGADEGGAPTPPADTSSVTLTLAEFERLMTLRDEKVERQISSAMGKIGGIERWRTQQEEQAAKTAKLRAKITDDKLAKLRNDDFEEAADALEIIRDTTVLPVTSGAADGDEVEKLRSEFEGKLLERDRVSELKALTRMHPDWQKVKDEKGFKDYVNKLPEAEQDKLGSVWDADYVGGHLSAYKKSRTAPPSGDPPSPPAPDRQQRRGLRLAGGATPRGSGAATGPASDPEAEMDEGYRTRRVGN